MPTLRSKPCPGCKQTADFELTEQEMADYRANNMLIQQALPRLSNDDRERLISGYCPPCWNKLFPSGEDEE